MADLFVVIESCDDYEQILGLQVGKYLPDGGILCWSGEAKRRAFGARKEARAAINRTEHYRLAYGRADLPERKFCRVEPLVVPNA